MAEQVVLYGNIIRHMVQKELHWQNDTIKVALLTSSYSPDMNGHSYWSDVSSSQASGSGYTAGGATLGSKTQNYNSALKVWTFNAAPVEWSNATVTARYAVIYSDTPSTASTKPVLALVDFGSERAASEGTFRITWNANGIFDVAL